MTIHLLIAPNVKKPGFQREDTGLGQHAGWVGEGRSLVFVVSAAIPQGNPNSPRGNYDTYQKYDDCAHLIFLWRATDH